MRNIYDIFEENDKIYQLLKESDEEIINEQNQLIEWKTAWYTEKLILEQMMYEDFNEEKIEALIESKFKETMGKAVIKTGEFIDKFLVWIEDIIITFSEKMSICKKLLDKYGRQNIANALRTSEIKVKLNTDLDVEVVRYLIKIFSLFNDINAGEIDDLSMQSNDFKDELLKKLNVNDTNELINNIKNGFISEDKSTVKQIKDIVPTDILYWFDTSVCSKLISSFKSVKRDFALAKRFFKVSKDKNDSGVQQMISNCSFTVSLLRKVINTTIIYYLKVVNICKSIVLKVMNKESKNIDKDLRPGKDKRKGDQDEFWEDYIEK